MRVLCSIALIGAALLASGCSSLSVKHDFDTEADFTTYEKYVWLEQPTTAVGDAKTAQRVNTLLDKRIRSAVDAELTSRGMSLDANDPDLLVVYHTGLDQKVDVQDWGYSYPRYPYGGWYGGQVDVYEYEEGTLIVDLIDAKSDQLVWRGTATKVIDPTASTEKREANLREVVTKLFANYPPRR